MAPGLGWPLQLGGWTMNIASDPAQYVLSEAHIARNGSLFTLNMPQAQIE